MGHVASRRTGRDLVQGARRSPTITLCTPVPPCTPALALQGRGPRPGRGLFLELPNCCLSQFRWIMGETGLFLTVSPEDAFPKSEGGQSSAGTPPLSLCQKLQGHGAQAPSLGLAPADGAKGLGQCSVENPGGTGEKGPAPPPPQ